MSQKISLSARIPNSGSGQRLDQVSAQLFPEYSRARIQEWIKAGALTLAGRKAKGNTKVAAGEKVDLEVELTATTEWRPEPMDLDIVHEDSAIMVINKPAGLVVHPAAGNYEGTLMNGLLHYLPELANIPRAGIVHRLDKDTTGLMVVAKTLESQSHLVSQMQERSVSRIYRALVIGKPPVHGTVEAPIGRDPSNRKRMAVVTGSSGKEAMTHFDVIKRWPGVSWLELKLETGRTHQIRVHMAHIGFPLVGDPLYGRTIRKDLVSDKSMRQTLAEFPRQALHATSLSLMHPSENQLVTWTVDVPTDLRALLNALDEQ